jgi:hypothetical protein
VIALGLARLHRRVGIVEVMRELALKPDVLAAAVGAQALVALLPILLAQGLLVQDRGLGLGSIAHGDGNSCIEPTSRGVKVARRYHRRSRALPH